MSAKPERDIILAIFDLESVLSYAEKRTRGGMIDSRRIRNGAAHWPAVSVTVSLLTSPRSSHTMSVVKRSSSSSILLLLHNLTGDLAMLRILLLLLHPS